jgi:hypothetical protein
VVSSEEGSSLLLSIFMTTENVIENAADMTPVNKIAERNFTS